ncbi:GPI mannosyltransferase 1, putative [Eimeria brunetti]|uniref:GPI mannosyltransferase 1 n=1 Tax=Eimeria brunetti TaxID=51314 RepID=U6LPL2_9EIME|nr:GPI mannosyltransferase 1, putative [Eimeria brunetti]
MSKRNSLLGLQPQQMRHLLFAAGALLRLLLLAYGEWQDSHMAVKFTDIDYKVYTDAAERILKGGSPYERHTYRYSPLVAYFCLPNLLGCPFFGKLLFCCVDMAVALLIEQVLWMIYMERQQQKQQQLQDKPLTGRQCESIGGGENNSSSGNMSSTSSKCSSEEYPLHTFLLPSFCWLFHPVVATVSARGNADSIPCLLVLLTVAAVRARKLILSAVLYGLAVHLKVYPVIYGVPILLSMQRGALGLSQQQQEQQLLYLLRLGSPAMAATTTLNALLANYNASAGRYGFPFVFESYLYHATRSDHRHNMSPYFYLLYLDSVAPVKGLSVALLLPQLLCALLLGCFFAASNLEAGLFLETVAFVALNKVCTTQYFLWWLCLLPFAVGATDMKKNTLLQTGLAMAVFQVACLFWLFFGYKLEFEGKPVFLELSLTSAAFASSQMGLVVFFSHKIRSQNKTRRAEDGVSVPSEAAALERKRV